MKTLFLDFDGVLHPSTAILDKDVATLALQGGRELLASGLFQWSHLLEQALRDAEGDDEIVVVVHSSWRNQPWMSSSLAREVLGPLGHRFAGFLEGREPREPAIVEFVARMDIHDFLILDDSHAEFSALSDKLITTNPLLGVSEPHTLAQISAWCASTNSCKQYTSCTA